ncbi:hypothetical protein QUB33_07060 [Microcoleus sp. B3-A4]|uniref:hypothetical protein n=1 Tax=Microcoleus sp. B3-A4 TaxID=2818653 RepID=UPI002FD54BD6
MGEKSVEIKVEAFWVKTNIVTTGNAFARSRSRLSETIRSLNHLCRLDAKTVPAFDRANCTTIRQLAITQHS